MSSFGTEQGFILLSQNINENTPGDRINGVTYIMTLQKIMQGISLVL